MELGEVLKLIAGLADTYLINKPYIVGGLPRDVYLQKEKIKTTDIDLTTNSNDVMRLGILVANDLNVTFELSDDGHMTVFTDRFDLDFSSHFVSEAVVEHLNGDKKGLEEAYSRDFTINTIHQDLVTGEIIDPTGMGLKDIDDKLIRTPVPPEITLTDDPRRIYRAINLAARYGYEIDDDIKKFVLKNPEVFSGENIKDKYIAVKISKALKENEEYTIKALKELGLFKHVPLLGYFKEVLIKRKLLVDYLGNDAFDKYSSLDEIDQHGWRGYVNSGGPENLELAEWWIEEYKNMPGNHSPSYNSWTRWYMDKYRNEWGGKHKGPEDTLSLMKEIISGGAFEKLIEMRDSVSENRNQKKPDKVMAPEKAEETLETRPNEPYYNVNKKNNTVDIDNVSAPLREFINRLGQVANELGAETPVITSGFRSPYQQAMIMFNNWKRKGGHNGGGQYLRKLYGVNYGGEMDHVFKNFSDGANLSEQGVSWATKVAEAYFARYGHGGTRPSSSIDLRLTSGIEKVVDTIIDSGEFIIKKLDEGNHFHVSVRGFGQKNTSVLARRNKILNIANGIK